MIKNFINKIANKLIRFRKNSIFADSNNFAGLNHGPKGMVNNFGFDEQLRHDFHMPGIEPWLSALLKTHKLDLVLDIGAGMGFWGFLIKSYLTRSKTCNPTIIGLDIIKEKISQLKRLEVYDELILGDVRALPFKVKTFNTVLAVESLYGNWFQGVLNDLELSTRDGGLIIISRGLDKKEIVGLHKRGYDVYRVYLMGVVLSKFKNGRNYFAIKEITPIVPILKLLIMCVYKALRYRHNYCIAVKRIRVAENEKIY